MTVRVGDMVNHNSRFCIVAHIGTFGRQHYPPNTIWGYWCQTPKEAIEGYDALKPENLRPVTENRGRLCIHNGLVAKHLCPYDYNRPYDGHLILRLI